MTTESTELETPINDAITLVGGAPSLFRKCSNKALNQLTTEVNPDAYFLTGTTEPYTGATQIKHELPERKPVLYPGNAQYGRQESLKINNIDIIVCPEFDDLYDIYEYEKNGTINTNTETIVLSNLLSVDIDMSDLVTTLAGLDRYTQSLQPDQLSGSYTHVSASIQAGYCRDWNELTVYGSGFENGGNTSQFIVLTITQNGYISTERIDSGKLGLQAIEGVGPKTAKTLKNNGFDTQKSISNADLQVLTEISGVGETKATTMKNSARALTENEVIHTSTDPVPASEPVFIDIETDGLNPTRVWLIGVKNGVNGEYMSFIETDVDENGKAVTAFMMWLRANATEKTLLAWNGWNFDFPVLREHIQQHCPQYADTWETVSKRDPLRWARDLDNAILPGRTNKLEDVANALGWDGHQTGLSGAEVARRVRNWIENPCPETELNWGLHEQYCQDDVEALEFIYEAMKNASKVESTVSSDRVDVEEETVQAGLFDSY